MSEDIFGTQNLTKTTRNGPDENPGFSFCLNTAAEGMAIQLIIK